MRARGLSDGTQIVLPGAYADEHRFGVGCWKVGRLAGYWDWWLRGRVDPQITQIAQIFVGMGRRMGNE